MYKFVKVIHVLGLVLFFGSIPGHITAGFVPGAHDDPQTALVVRQVTEVATSYLTLPGLVLVVGSGIAMVIVGRLRVPRTRWLVVHAAIAVIVVLNAFLMLYPTGQELLATASKVAVGAAPMDALQVLEGREAAFGAVNLVLCVATVFLAVIKPRLGGTKT